jgi:hypothetical protein
MENTMRMADTGGWMIGMFDIAGVTKKKDNTKKDTDNKKDDKTKNDKDTNSKSGTETKAEKEKAFDKKWDIQGKTPEEVNAMPYSFDGQWTHSGMKIIGCFIIMLMITTSNAGGLSGGGSIIPVMLIFFEMDMH